MKHIIIAVFLFLKFISFGQASTKDTISFADKHKYFRFLSGSENDGHATMFTAAWQYLYSPSAWGKTFRTGGMQPSIGINIARFFSSKFVLGLFIDIKGVKGFTQQKFSSEFINNFNNCFITSYTDQADSAKAYTVKDAINGHSFAGNYCGDYGIMFSPFPQKYGGVMICVKKGYRSYPIFGTYGNKYIHNGDADDVTLDLSNIYTFEIKIKPATFFHEGNNNFEDLHSKDYWQFFTIGFYCERLYLKNATFDGMRFDNMVNTSFINKYGTSTRYGITIGFAIY
jgi:hypothetical protein